jgi:hypothetical protein
LLIRQICLVDSRALLLSAGLFDKNVVDKHYPDNQTNSAQKDPSDGMQIALHIFFDRLPIDNGENTPC